MFPLDHKTVERVARLVCDLGGPNERRGYELEQLLRGAGWQDSPDYDGTPRTAWLVEAIQERATSRADIERLLCRVCDPVEYEAGMAAAGVMQNELNRILEPECLAITYLGGRPVLAELTASGERPAFGAPDDLRSRLEGLISDEKATALLVDRVAQSRAAQESGAYLLAIFGIGSFIEGLLFTVLLERYPELESGFTGRDGKKVPSRRAGLELLIDTAHDRELIQLDAKNFMHPVRDFRNYIHPRQQLEKSFSPDQDTVALCWAPIHALLNDLEANLPQPV
ncbi:hypothetical protein [Actinokineospora inagensis]|uniref:hypothetical protein n=1 Tax=Actinokineospora inagensis TaxID=103730 RepID=UPI000416C185|nr:hypothetical protein [Actinokineospora inagensis]